MSAAPAGKTGRTPSDDAHGIPYPLWPWTKRTGSEKLNTTSVQWLWYAATALIVVGRSWFYFHDLDAKTWEDAFKFLLFPIVAMIVLWPIVTYHIHTKIPIDEKGVKAENPPTTDKDEIKRRIHTNVDARALLMP